MSNTTVSADCTTARNDERTLTEIHAIVDRMLADAAAAPKPVQPVNGYRREVDDMDQGRAFMRAGVGGKQCSYMEIVRVTANDSGVVTLWVVDCHGGRDLVRFCDRYDLSWKTVETHGVLTLVPAR